MKRRAQRYWKWNEEHQRSYVNKLGLEIERERERERERESMIPS